MNINFENYLIPVITVGCLCVGFVLKKWLPTDDKWIPTILLVLGALSGLILFGFDYEGVVKGMLSGLASVGVHQLFKQQLKIPMGADELYAMGQYETIADEDESEVEDHE